MDKREAIALKYGLCKCGEEYKSRKLSAPDCPMHAYAVFEAMDDHATAMCMDLLEYMAKNEVSCEINIAKQKRFYFKGQWIDKEQLFEDFL